MTPDSVTTIRIAAPIDVVWAELLRTETPRPWLYDTVAISDWEVDGRHQMIAPNGTLMIDGDVLEVDAPHRIVMGYHCHWDDEVEAETGATLTWELREVDEGTELTAFISNAGPATAASSDESMEEIYTGLKRYLEDDALAG